MVLKPRGAKGELRFTVKHKLINSWHSSWRGNAVTLISLPTSLSLQVVEDVVKKVMESVPKPLPIADIMEKYPVTYTESMNTVLVQEVIRYNRLLKVIHSSLQDLKKALKGLVVMSEALETMFNSIYNNEVPEMWAAKVCVC